MDWRICVDISNLKRLFQFSFEFRFFEFFTNFKTISANLPSHFFFDFLSYFAGKSTFFDILNAKFWNKNLCQYFKSQRLFQFPSKFHFFMFFTNFERISANLPSHFFDFFIFIFWKMHFFRRMKSKIRFVSWNSKEILTRSVFCGWKSVR